MGSRFDLAEIQRRYPIISSLEEERRMIAVERHNEARCRELLVLHNVGACVSMGVQYAPACGGIEDGIQVALIGLMKAARDFDLDRNVKFITFAIPKIMGSVAHEAVRRSNIMHSHFVSSMNRPVKAKKSTDQGAEGNEVANFIHRLVDEDYKDSFKIGMDPVHKTETEDVNSLIVKCINDCNVPEWHKEAAIMYFGLSENGGLQDATYENIGEKYGVTRERIRQILSKVLVSARFRLEKIPDLASQIEERKKNALQVKRSGISKVYARLAQPSKKKLKKEDLKHRAIITGFSNFYCERYQQTVKAVAKAKERDIPLGSANGAPLPLSALREAMHRRSAVQYVARMHPVEMKKEREVEGESTTLAKAMERDDGDIKIENITDIKEDFAEENINAIDNAVARIEQEEMSGYGVGTFEDDGDADYEVEEVA